MPRRSADAFDPDALAHRLRGSLHNLVLWSEVLARQLRNAPPTVQRTLEGLRQAVQEQVGMSEALLGRLGAGTSSEREGSDRQPPSP